jgi:hypothetical protein
VENVCRWEIIDVKRKWWFGQQDVERCTWTTWEEIGCVYLRTRGTEMQRENSVEMFSWARGKHHSVSEKWFVRKTKRITVTPLLR